jgi:hypothetical protein
MLAGTRVSKVAAAVGMLWAFFLRSGSKSGARRTRHVRPLRWLLGLAPLLMVLVPSVNARAGDPPVTFQPGHTYWASLVEGRGSTGVVDDVTAGGTTFATLAISRSDFGQFAWSLDLKTLYLAERGVGSVVAPLTVEAARVPASRAAARWSTPHPPTSAAVSARCSASPSWCGDGARRRDRAGIRTGGSPGEAPDRCGAHLWVSEAVPRASNTISQGCGATSQACESFFRAANPTSHA